MRRLLLILCLFSFLSSKGQESYMNLSVLQDSKLLLFGDNIGNSAFTPDIIVRLDIDAIKVKKSDFVFSVGTEFANLDSAYFLRFFLGAGFVTEFTFLKKFKFGAFINHGIIIREKGRFLIKSQQNNPPNTQQKVDEESSFMSFSTDFETTYPISEKTRLSLKYQLLNRKDLSSRFKTSSTIKGSLFLGVKFAL